MIVNPEMIVLARECRGWTQRELAAELEISQATMSKYELAMLRYPNSDVPRLAECTNFEPEFFAQSVSVVGLAGDFLYRKKAHVPAKVRRRVQAEANIRMMQVERLMKRAEVVRDELPFPAIQTEEFDGRVDRIAQEVRRIWRLPPGPIRNVTNSIENAGGIVFSIDFETDLIDGTNIRLPGVPPMLFVNAKAPGDRHRFNLAHELGHSIMHFGMVCGDPEEEANQFACEFLMPRASIRSDLRNLDLTSAAQLKLVWGVSMAAIIKRAYDLGTITQSTYRRLFTALNARGMRTREPLEIPHEKPEVFDEMIAVHRDSFQMNSDQLRKVLFTDSFGRIEPSKDLRIAGTERSLFDGPTDASDSTELSPPSSQSKPSSSDSTFRLGLSRP